jgi:hypothetical protein
MGMTRYLMLGPILAGMVILAVPISLGYDSGEKWFKVRWLGLTITKRLRAEKPEKPRKITKKKRKFQGRAIMGLFWQKRDLVAELSNRLGRFVLGVFRTLTFRDCEASLSLPDPMWNGVLYGALTDLNLPDWTLAVNFDNHNYAKIWVTLYPYRVAWQLAALLLRLPYLHLIRLAWDLKHQVVLAHKEE